MCVERDRKSVVLVLRDVEHAGAEVLGLDCGLPRQQLEDLPDDWIVNSLERFHDSTRRSDVDLVSEPFCSFLESFLRGELVRCLNEGGATHTSRRSMGVS